MSRLSLKILITIYLSKLVKSQNFLQNFFNSRNNVLNSNTNSNANLLANYIYSACPAPEDPQIIYDEKGTLFSSNYQLSKNYNVGENCSWVIQAPANKRIKVLVIEAKFEQQAGNDDHNCIDYLEIVDPAVPESIGEFF